MHHARFAAASASLFDEELIDAVEWSFDTGWGLPLEPWLEGLLEFFGKEGRLFGHGVSMSPLSAAPSIRRESWLASLEGEVRAREYRHISEHYGCMTTPRFRQGSPMPMPNSAASLAVARQAFDSLKERAIVPIGIENLALATSREEALAHGPWLATLLSDASDFIVLDVHNLYCQARNFDIEPESLLSTFPLARVRELHVSGGSDLPAWPGGETRVRCDTHDEAAPAGVFELAKRALESCPNVDVVIYERLGSAFRTEDDNRAFRTDVLKLRAILDSSACPPSRGNVSSDTARLALLDDDRESLAAFQDALLDVLWELGAPHSASWSNGADRSALSSEVRTRLERIAQGTPYASWIDGADDRALGIAVRAVGTHLRRG